MQSWILARTTAFFPRSFMHPLGLDLLTAPLEMTIGVGSTNVPTHFANIDIDLQGVIRFPVYAGSTPLVSACSANRDFSILS
jgi:hypothetical protein